MKPAPAPLQPGHAMAHFPMPKMGQDAESLHHRRSQKHLSHCIGRNVVLARGKD